MRYFTESDELERDRVLSMLLGENLRWEDETLFSGDQALAVITVERRGVDLSPEEVEDLLEFLEEAEGDVRRVKKHLKASKTMVCAQVLQWGVVDRFPTFDFLWIGLFEGYPGLLQVNGEGCSERRALSRSVD